MDRHHKVMDEGHRGLWEEEEEEEEEGTVMAHGIQGTRRNYLQLKWCTDVDLAKQKKCITAFI